MSRRLDVCARLLTGLLLLTLLSACTSSQSVRNLANRAVNNEQVLSDQSQALMHDLQASLEQQQQHSEQAVERLIKTCRDDVSQRKQLLNARLQVFRERMAGEFEGRAWQLLTSGFDAGFNQRYAMVLNKEGTAKQAELAAARERLKQFPADMALKEKVETLRLQTVSIASRGLRDELELRDKLRARLTEARDEVRQRIADEAAAIQPQIDALSGGCDDITIDLSAFDDARRQLQDLNAKLIELHVGQQQALITLKDYTERSSIVQLVVSGATGAVQARISGIQDLLVGKVKDINQQIQNKSLELVASLDKQAGVLNGFIDAAQGRVGELIERKQAGISDTLFKVLSRQ